MPLWHYLENGGKRAAVVWHRRAGKDSTSLNWTAVASHQRAGNYWHMLPEARQGRKAVWNAVDREGRRVIDQAFPLDLRTGIDNTEMLIRLKCGSTWQVCGSDNFNSLVGSNPVGVVFSEFSIAKPAAWDFIRPILAENGGWALFIYTPRGENHGFDLYEMARGHPDWFAQLLTVDDTGVIAPSVLDEERRSGMPEEMIEQEYYCSFTAALVGSYYGKLIEAANKEGRVGGVAYDPALPVHTVWDLGISDSMAIWIFQLGAGQIRVLDYYENHGEGFPHYVEVLDRRGWKGGDDWIPHDGRVRELGTGRTRVETLGLLGRKPRLVPDHKIPDGINAVRQTLPRVWFDAERCAKGLKALKHYQREWDEDKRCFKDAPLHDWTSHAADAFRYLCMAWREIVPPPPSSTGRHLRIGEGNEVTLNDLWKHAPGPRRRI